MRNTFVEGGLATYNDTQSLAEWTPAISKLSGKFIILERDLKVQLTLELPEKTEFKYVYRAFLLSLKAQGLETQKTGRFVMVVKGAGLRARHRGPASCDSDLQSRKGPRSRAFKVLGKRDAVAPRHGCCR